MIAELLAVAAELPSAFLACQVVEVGTDVDYIAFQRQTRAIIDAQQTRIKKLKMLDVSSHYLESRNRDAIAETIRGNYDRLAAQNAQINKELNQCGGASTRF